MTSTTETLAQQAFTWLGPRLPVVTLLEESQNVPLLGVWPRWTPALDPEPVVLVPQTSRDTFDLARDASRESGAGLKRPLDHVSQIAVIVPTPTSCHGMDR